MTETLARRTPPRARGLVLPRIALRDAAAVVASRFGTSALSRPAPAAVVTFAGVQGGAGVSTTALLVCGAVTRASDRPAVAIDLAAGTRGGLGGHAGAWSQASAECTAELVIEGGRLARPYAQTDAGVHVISNEPQAPVSIAGDDEWGRRIAVQKLVRAARAPHSFVAVDLGLADDCLLSEHASISDLHVWVVSARCDDLEVARRRLLTHEVIAVRELVLAWQPHGERIGSRGLRSLGEARGCPVARLARFDRAGSWADREQACRAGLEAVCRQLD